MRVVLDASVLIAAIARPGVCTELLDEVVRDHSLVLSEFILEEVGRKLREKFGVPKIDAAGLVNGLRLSCAELVLPADVPMGTCRDSEDLPILGTAAAGQVQLLITVDKDLLTLGSYQGTTIVKPGEFWRRLRAG